MVCLDILRKVIKIVLSAKDFKFFALKSSTVIYCEKSSKSV